MASFDRTFFPKLLENCSEGLVNNIVFTGTETHPNHVRCGVHDVFVHNVFTDVYIITMCRFRPPKKWNV